MQTLGKREAFRVCVFLAHSSCHRSVYSWMSFKIKHLSFACFPAHILKSWFPSNQPVTVVQWVSSPVNDHIYCAFWSSSLCYWSACRSTTCFFICIFFTNAFSCLLQQQHKKMITRRRNTNDCFFLFVPERKKYVLDSVLFDLSAVKMHRTMNIFSKIYYLFNMNLRSNTDTLGSLFFSLCFGNLHGTRLVWFVLLDVLVLFRSVEETQVVCISLGRLLVMCWTQNCEKNHQVFTWNPTESDIRRILC